MSKTIQVLVVDDSTFMRKSLSAMLTSDSRIAVAGMARNGEEAIQQVKALKPDVLTMDVEMPGMNGIEAVRRIMAECPVPIVMVSSLTTDGAKDTLRALEYGAVDYIPKQLGDVVIRIFDIRAELVAKIITASQASGKLAIRRLSEPMAPIVKPAGGALSAHSVSVTRGNSIVAIGCSTGGPQALMEVLSKLPADFPAAIVIVQHMPKSFTKPFAERMNQICQLEVKEAVDGEEVRAGLVLIAPGGVQFRVKKKTITTNIVSLSPNNENHLHAPAADIMLQSVAALYGERGIGIILTGMGHDGLEGMKAIKASKGRTIVQDEKTCIVYGMPKAVVEAGCADKVVALPQIVGEVLNMV